MTDAGLGLQWRVTYLSDSPRWLAKHMGDAVDALAKTAVWDELEILGVPRAAGKPFPSAAAVKKHLKVGRTTVLARGGPDATASYTLASARLTLEPQGGGFAITATIQGESLQRLGDEATGGFAAAIAALSTRWRGHAHLLSAWATPTAREAFRYRRARPPRVTHPHRSLAAIVDVFDAKSADHATPDAVAARELAVAEVKPPARRAEQDGMVTITWVDDPRDEPAVAEGAAAHEAWLLARLPSTPSPNWNEAGDERVHASHHPAPAPFHVVLRYPREDGDRYVGFIEVEEPPGAAAWERLREVAASRRLPGALTLTRIGLVLPGRAEALAAREDARRAGFDLVVYAGPGATLWDPDPPGIWIP